MAYQRNRYGGTDDTQQKKPGMLDGYLQNNGVQSVPYLGALPQSNMANPAMGPSPTGTHINFDRVYGANEGVAQREANRVAGNVQNKANQAQTGLTNLYGQFGQQVRAGTVGSPTDAQREWARNASTGVVPGKTVADAAFKSGSNDSTRNSVTERQQEFDAMGAGVVRDANGNVIRGDAPRDLTADAATEAALRAQAAGKYTGPMSLAEAEGFQDASGLGRDATHDMSILNSDGGIKELAGPDATELDASLLGAAGRPRFAEMYGHRGDLAQAFRDALTQSGKDVAAAQQTSLANSGESKGLLGEYLKRQGVDQEAEDARQKNSDDIIARAQKQAENERKFKDAGELANKGDNRARNILHTVGEIFSPSSWIARATGNKTPVEAGTNWFDKQFLGGDPSHYQAYNSRAWDMRDPEQADVFGSMTDADWVEFNNMGVKQQEKWIEERKRKLRGGD